MDGMGTVHALLSCQDEFIQNQKPPLKSYSWLDYIDRGFPSLIALKWVGPKLLSIPSGTRNENPLRQSSPKKKEYVCEVTKPYQIQDLKAAGKKYAATINDILVTAVAKAMKQEMLIVDPEDKTEFIGAA